MAASEAGPGPAYAVDPLMTRHGKDGTPCYSMLARQRDMSNIFLFSVPLRIYVTGSQILLCQNSEAVR